MRNKFYHIIMMTLCTWGVIHTQEISSTSKGKFSGYMFGDYFYNIVRDTAINSLKDVATGGEKSFNAFQFRRIYFTYDYDISNQFASRFRLEADQSALSSDGKIGISVKDAFLRWKNIFQGSDLSFGIQPIPAFEISESFWGYRSLDKTIMDLRGIVSSRDLGVSLKGKIDDVGIFNYSVMVGNGNSNKPEIDKYKRYYAIFHIKPSQNLRLTLYGDYKDQAYINDPTSSNATLSHAALSGALFAGYSQPEFFNIGVESFFQSTKNDYKESSSLSLSRRNTLGMSFFGWVTLRSDLSLVGRYDYFDPNINRHSKGDSRNYFIAGLAWRPDKNVSIIPNIQIETYETKPNNVTFKPSVTGRITLYYIFQ